MINFGLAYKRPRAEAEAEEKLGDAIVKYVRNPWNISSGKLT